LARWISDQDSSDHVARVLGISRTSLNRLARGEQRPSLELAVLIERVTGIPCAFWVDPPAIPIGKNADLSSGH
jgi:transcriptional regulator with XRE-family HTH domain